MKRKRINVILPLSFMKKGDRMYIYPGSFLIQPTKKEDIGLLYIHRNPILSPQEEDGYFPILKVGHGFSSSDFKIEFKASDYISFYIYEFDQSEWLKPVKVSLNLVTPLNVDNLLDYSSLKLHELENMLEDILSENNLNLSKSKIQKIFQALTKVAKKEYYSYDTNSLYNEKLFIDGNLNNLFGSDDGRDQLLYRFYLDIKQVLIETIAIREEKPKKKERKLSLEELKRKITTSVGKDVDIYLDYYSREIKKNKSKNNRRGGE